MHVSGLSGFGFARASSAGRTGAAASAAPNAFVPVGIAVAQVAEGPLVSIYLPDGSEAEIPSNYITNGIYVEDGVTWSSTPPKQITIYSPFNDEAVVPEGLLKNGQYIDEQGFTWTQTRQQINNVTIYTANGDEAEIPSVYVKNGQYVEDGIKWSTTPPKTVKIYSEFGDVAEVYEFMLTNGKYKDDEGYVWTTTPTVAQQVASSLKGFAF
jgi:hypothetical protein